MTTALGKTLRHTALGLALAGLTAVLGPEAHSAEGGQVGVLSCKSVEGGSNWVLYSETEVRCVFETPDGREPYNGTLHLAGLDLSFSTERRLRFAVLTAGTKVGVGEHGLAGDYSGAQASAALGVEAGASVLLGGSADNIALQPLGIQTGEGVGLQLGGSWFELRPAEREES